MKKICHTTSLIYFSVRIFKKIYEDGRKRKNFFNLNILKKINLTLHYHFFLDNNRKKTTLLNYKLLSQLVETFHLS